MVWPSVLVGDAQNERSNEAIASRNVMENWSGTRLSTQFPLNQPDSAPRRQGLRTIRKFAHHSFENVSTGIGVLPVSDVPRTNRTQPVGPFGLRLLGHVQQQRHLLDAQVRFIKSFR